MTDSITVGWGRLPDLQNPNWDISKTQECDVSMDILQITLMHILFSLVTITKTHEATTEAPL